jgi:hypothetical protein
MLTDKTRRTKMISTYTNSKSRSGSARGHHSSEHMIERSKMASAREICKGRETILSIRN